MSLLHSHEWDYIQKRTHRAFTVNHIEFKIGNSHLYYFANSADRKKRIVNPDSVESLDVNLHAKYKVMWT